MRRADAACVVDARLPQALAAGDPLQELDLARTHWLAKACERAGAVYLLLSADQVFSGLATHPYREDEAPDAQSEAGLALREAERLALDGSSRSTLLRAGPVFGSVGAGLLSDTLAALAAQRALALDDVDAFCPVPAEDLARVVAGMLDQIDTGAEAAGVFHYASPDRTTLYGFAEAVVAVASQFSEVASAAIGRAPRSEGAPACSWALDCRRLRDTFAIKQQPWRAVIGDCVRSAFLTQAGD